MRGEGIPTNTKWYTYMTANRYEFWYIEILWYMEILWYIFYFMIFAKQSNLLSLHTQRASTNLLYFITLPSPDNSRRTIHNNV